jgi:hypothetical protein
MNPFSRVVLFGALVVLAFDVIAATASRMLDFPYGFVALGSYLIYAAAGHFAARATGSISRGALAGFAVGLVESTLGWLLSAVIGPGRPIGAAAEPLLIAVAVVVVPVSAAFAGFVGAAISRFFSGGRSRPD